MRATASPSTPSSGAHSKRVVSPGAEATRQPTSAQPSGPWNHLFSSSGSWWASQTCRGVPCRIRVTRTVRSSRSCDCVPVSAAKVASSVTTASIWPIASRVPSSMPISMSCSSSARLVK